MRVGEIVLSEDKWFLVGVALAIAGNCLIAVSLATQKYVHNKLSADDVGKSWLFYASIAGMIFGEVGNFAAFGFASPTVISPCRKTES